MSSSAALDDDFLEDYYDVIILSTGLGSSILAAALAKAGKSVLHLDRNEHYGEESASFSFIQLLDWAKSHRHGQIFNGEQGEGKANDVDLDASSPDSPVLDELVSGGGGRLDARTMGITIARALARHELKMEIASKKEKDTRSSSDEAVKGIGSEAVKGSENEAEETVSCTRDDGNGEHSTPTSTDDTAQGASTPKTQATSGDSSQETMPTSGRHEEKLADEIESDALDDAASIRLQSLDLHLLKVKYHGCHTLAGEPSDTCRKELADFEAEQKEAAAAGRYLRGIAPSHPAWLGRGMTRKESAAPHTWTSEVRTSNDQEDGGEAGGEGGRETKLHPSYWGFRTENEPRVEDLVRRSRSFNIDLTSQVILSTGSAVDALVTSGVASYLEFKDMQALFLGSDVRRQWRGEEGGHRSSRGFSSSPVESHGATNSTRGQPAAASGPAATVYAPGLTTNVACIGGRRPSTGHGLALSRVPCSKADVFTTKLLSPLEKRRLMRFLLFASDWGLQRAGEDVLARNEVGLGRGRSLRRPQNREAASSDFEAAAYSGKPFREFLESCGLPERVRAMVMHALALLAGTGGGDGGESAESEAAPAYAEPTTEEGLEAVYRHLSALGRFGETAFITPLYGVGELPQAFCRMAAVYGAVYVLRRDVKGIALDRTSGKCVGVVDESGRVYACGSLVMGGEYYHTFPQVRLATGNDGVAEKPKDKERRHRGLRLLRRVVVTSGPVAPDAAGRGLCVLPPGLRCIGNEAAVHAISLDEHTAACPDSLGGACVLHLTTTAYRRGAAVTTGASSTAVSGVGNEGTEPGALGNAGVTDQERRVERDCSRGDVPETFNEEENGRESVLARAAKALLESAGVKEVWSLGFSWDLQDAVPDEDLPSNVVVCPRPAQELYMHEVLNQAERAFSRLCPGKPFWPPLATAEDEDDQAEMLRAVASTVEDETSTEDGGTRGDGADGVTAAPASGDVVSVDADDAALPVGSAR